MNQDNLFSSPRWTVTSITAYLREMLESDEMLRDAWVKGELSNLSRPRSGHIYFTLKDGGASLRCLMWRSSAARLNLELREGMEVEVRGYISITMSAGNISFMPKKSVPLGRAHFIRSFCV